MKKIETLYLDFESKKKYISPDFIVIAIPQMVLLGGSSYPDDPDDDDPDDDDPDDDDPDDDFDDIDYDPDEYTEEAF